MSNKNRNNPCSASSCENVPAEAAGSLMPVAHILSIQTRSGQMEFWFLAKDAILYKDEQVGPWIRECNLHISCFM